MIDTENKAIGKSNTKLTQFVINKSCSKKQEDTEGKKAKG